MVTRTIAGLLWQPLDSPSWYQLLGSAGAVALVFDDSDGVAEWLLVLNREVEPIIAFCSINDAAEYFVNMCRKAGAAI